MTESLSHARRSFVAQRGFVGVWMAGYYVSLRSPRYRPYFSERNRIKCRVLPLGRGWRIVVRPNGGFGGG